MTLLVKLDTEGEESLDYKPGDHVTIFPANNATLVESLLGQLDDAEEPDKPINIQISMEESGRQNICFNDCGKRRMIKNVYSMTLVHSNVSRLFFKFFSPKKFT